MHASFTMQHPLSVQNGVTFFILECIIMAVQPPIKGK